MKDFNISKIEITDKDIKWIQEIMPEIEFDDDRIKALKSLDSVDINACPGSGKTTLLVSKLAILANKWPYTNKGICVLSHTNVAREEIQNRLGDLAIGKKLLSYPHFIGTFQSYLDTFFAIPYLKSNKSNIKIVDDQYVLSKRWSRMKYKTYLENNNYDQYVFDPAKLPYELNIKCGANTKTYKSIVKIVEDSRNIGEYTFNEMRLYAAQYIAEYPEVCEIARKRFPIIFIDESQDTENYMWEIITKVYVEGSNTVWQSFGDINQAIYNGFSSNDKKTIFPRENQISITNTKRLPNSIAKLANTVAINKSIMIGQSTEFINNKNTIILFDKNSSSQVIHCFADIIYENFSDDDIIKNQRFGCHAIGLIHKLNKDDNDNFAKRVSNYYADYNPNPIKIHPEKLIDFFSIGQSNFIKSGNLSNKVASYSDGILTLIRKYPKNKNIYPTANFHGINGLNKYLNYPENFRKWFYEILHTNYDSPDLWKALIERLYNELGDIIDWKMATGEGFLNWTNNYTKTAQDSSCTENTICFKKDGRIDLPIHIGSIHSIKGRTHLATLVLETKYRAYNIKSIIEYLCGEYKKPTVTNANRLKCQYVAMTRAKGLLCMAIPKNNVTQTQKEKLIALGWEIVEI